MNTKRNPAMHPGRRIFIGLGIAYCVAPSRLKAVPRAVGQAAPTPESFGALGDGISDDQKPLQDFLSHVSSRGQTGLLGPRTYNHSGLLKLDGGVLVGQSGSRLHATNPDRAALYVGGDGATIRDVALSTDSTRRTSSNDAIGMTIIGANGASVSGCAVYGFAAGGIMVNGSTGVSLKGNHVWGTRADGIHITNRSSAIVVEGNRVERTGDDNIAVVSYVTNGDVCRDVTIRSNDCRDSDSRGIAVVGGSDVTITSNRITRSRAMGLNLASEDAYQTYAAKRVRVERNHLESCVVSSGPFRGGTINIGGRLGQARAGESMVDLLCSDIVLRENTIVGDGGDHHTYHVVIHPESSDVQLIGNTFDGLVHGSASVMVEGRSISVIGNTFVSIPRKDVVLGLLAVDCRIGPNDRRASVPDKAAH